MQNGSGKLEFDSDALNRLSLRGTEVTKQSHEIASLRSQ
jgi:hypothetical protein